MEKKYSKKINFDRAVKKIENISSKVDIIMRNKLIIALFLIVDGITFILNPDTTLPGMARNIILLIFLASFSVFITNFSAKEKDKKTILISLAIIVASIVFYIYPDLIAAYMQLLLSLFIIYDGLSNISNSLNLNKISKITQAIIRRYNNFVNRKTIDEKKKEQKEKFRDIDNNINEGLEQQKEKLITPLRNVVSRASRFSTLYIIVNTISIIFGLVLLVFPDASMMVWGIIFLYTGSSNLIVAIKTMDLLTKIKEKKFKEILLNTDKNNSSKKGNTGISK